MSDDAFEIRKQKLFIPFYAEAGAALAECQTLEYGIKLLLHHLARMDPGKITADQTIAMMENKDKKTLGQLVKLLKDNYELTENNDALLIEALIARNTIIHRFIIENTGMLPNHDTRRAVINDLQTLRAKVRQGRDSIHPVIHKLGIALDDFDGKTYMKELDKTLS